MPLYSQWATECGVEWTECFCSSNNLISGVALKSGKLISIFSSDSYNNKTNTSTSNNNIIINSNIELFLSVPLSPEQHFV